MVYIKIWNIYGILNLYILINVFFLKNMNWCIIIFIWIVKYFDFLLRKIVDMVINWYYICIL